MEFEGVVFRKLPEVTGSSARGAWKKQDVVFDMPSEFNRKICVTFFGDRSEDAAALNEGDAVSVSANVESREYNGKWFTNVTAWKIVRNNGSGASGGPGGAGGYAGGVGGAGSYAGGYAASDAPGRGQGSGSASAWTAASPSPMSGAPFNEETAPTAGSDSPADDVDDLPF